MLLKRSVFVILLIALFSGCFYIMNQHYDELARYPHELSEEERSLVLSHLSTEQINRISNSRAWLLRLVLRQAKVCRWH